MRSDDEAPPTPIVHLREADVTGGDSFHTT